MVTPAAKAAMTRRNKYIMAHWPLFFSLWYTTPQDEQDRLDRLHKHAEIHLARMAECDRQMQALADEMRSKIALTITPHQLYLLDRYRADFLPATPEYSADFWRKLQDPQVLANTLNQLKPKKGKNHA